MVSPIGWRSATSAPTGCQKLMVSSAGIQHRRTSWEPMRAGKSSAPSSGAWINTPRLDNSASISRIRSRSASNEDCIASNSSTCAGEPVSPWLASESRSIRSPRTTTSNRKPTRSAAMRRTRGSVRLADSGVKYRIDSSCWRVIKQRKGLEEEKQKTTIRPWSQVIL